MSVSDRALAKIQTAVLAHLAAACASGAIRLGRQCSAASHKLFELKVLSEILDEALDGGGGPFTCSHGSKLVLFNNPVPLAEAARFARSTSYVAFAINVRVSYGRRPTAINTHEADIAEFDRDALNLPDLLASDVRAVVECKYQKRVAKSVLRELAFTAKQLRAKSKGWDTQVLIAIPDPPVAARLPPYWQEAQRVYRVGVLEVEFP